METTTAGTTESGYLGWLRRNHQTLRNALDGDEQSDRGIALRSAQREFARSWADRLRSTARDGGGDHSAHMCTGSGKSGCASLVVAGAGGWPERAGVPAQPLVLILSPLRASRDAIADHLHNFLARTGTVSHNEAAELAAHTWRYESVLACGVELAEQRLESLRQAWVVASTVGALYEDFRRWVVGTPGGCAAQLRALLLARVAVIVFDEGDMGVWHRADRHAPGGGWPALRLWCAETWPQAPRLFMSATLGCEGTVGCQQMTKYRFYRYSYRQAVLDGVVHRAELISLEPCNGVRIRCAHHHHHRANSEHTGGICGCRTVAADCLSAAERRLVARSQSCCSALLRAALQQLDNWRERCGDQQAMMLVVAPTLRMVDVLQTEAAAQSRVALAIKGTSTDDHRNRALARAAAGAVDVLIVCSALARGANLGPHASCVLNLRPFANVDPLVQTVLGRVVRRSTEATHSHALIIESAANQHGRLYEAFADDDGSDNHCDDGHHHSNLAEKVVTQRTMSVALNEPVDEEGQELVDEDEQSEQDHTARVDQPSSCHIGDGLWANFAAGPTGWRLLCWLYAVPAGVWQQLHSADGRHRR